MEGLKEALEYAVKLSPANVYDLMDVKYADKVLHRIKDDTVKPIIVSSLESLVDYIHKNIDGLNEQEIFINIQGSKIVTLESKYNNDKERNKYIECRADIPNISYGQFYDNEVFNILMQSSFQDTKDKEIVLKVIGNLREETIKDTGDDGVSQSVAVRTGIANIQNVKVPNPVILKPYRTFVEVEQPESKFVFRMRNGGDCAIFEADGGAWTLQARKNIRNYLCSRLVDDLNKDIMIIG